LIDILICVIYADVIGIMTKVGVEREYEREGVKTKMLKKSTNENV